MQSENQVYAVDAKRLTGDEQENIVILIYAKDIEVAKNRIIVYQQQNQIRLHYSLLPLPLERYLQHHGDETFIEPIKALSQNLSETQPLILFTPNHYQESDKTTSPCLIKTQFLLRPADEAPSPDLFKPVPASVIPYLWQEDDAGRCYAVINAETSFWFPTRFERDDIHSACLYKGEEAEKRKKTAPYLLALPVNHPFAQELFTDAPLENGDGFQQWRKNFGFFFRSNASFDDLLHHFRKFIYMPTYDEQLLYFRFYDPIVLEEYLDRLICYPKKLATFFGGNLITSFLVPKGDEVVHYVPNMDLAEVTPAKKQFDKFEMDAFIEQYNQKLFMTLVDDMLETSPFLLERYTRKDIENVVAYHHNISGKYHFHESITIGFFTLVTLLYGHTIDTLDPESIILSILKSDYLTESNKIYYIRQRIEFMENQGMIYNHFEENKYENTKQ